MNFNLTVKALKDLRVQLGVSQKAIAHSVKICESVLSKFEREESPMPEDIHAAYERFLFEVLNGERKIDNSQSNVWRYAKTQAKQNSESKRERENKELAEARLKIKEYEALLGMYRKESRC